MKNKKYLIAVVEDEEDISDLMSLNLRNEGYEVKQFFDGQKFIESLKKYTFNLIILDLMLPGVNGLEICKYLRFEDKSKRIPIIMVTAKDGEADRVIGLELGADDYVVKPFSVRELMARVKAVLRRTDRTDEQTEQNTIEYKDLLIDSSTFKVKIRGEEIELTPTEFRLLTILVNKPGRVYDRDTLLDKLWGMEKIVIDRTIDVHIVKLRKKLGDYGSFIKSIRGIGYKFEG